MSGSGGSGDAGVAERMTTMLGAYADLETIGKTEILAAGAIGIAIAVAAFGPHLDVVLKRVEFQVTHPGLERSPTIKRLIVLTASVLMGGGIHVAATIYGFMNDLNVETEKSIAVALLLTGFGLYLLAFALYQVRYNVFDQGGRLLARAALNRVSPKSTRKTQSPAPSRSTRNP